MERRGCVMKRQMSHQLSSLVTSTENEEKGLYSLGGDAGSTTGFVVWNADDISAKIIRFLLETQSSDTQAVKLLILLAPFSAHLTDHSIPDK